MGAGSDRRADPGRVEAQADQRGAGGNIQFGFRLSRDGKHVEPNPSEQAVLTEIRHLRQSGHTLRGIAAALNRQSLRARRGSAWVAGACRADRQASSHR
jgi:hypothetical protein